MIAGLTALGLVPRATLEIPGGERRLDRIFALIQQCPYSVHDLSRVEFDPNWPKTPRFNMPLELGLTIALQKTVSPDHKWFVFEAKPRRIQKSMSDLDGTDVYVHKGRPSVLFSELANAFAKSERKATVQQMQRMLAGLKLELPRLTREAGTRPCFTARVFEDLRVVALRLSNRYVV